MLALTGTADSKTQNVIISQLAIKKPIVLFITPNRKNLRITVVKTKKNQMFCHLLWLVKLMGERVRNSKDNNLFSVVGIKRKGICTSIYKKF